MAENTEVAWAAGLFDGEGSVRKVDSRHRMISVQMTDLGILERFDRALGGVGGISGPRILPKRKPMWHWYACSENAVTVADLLLPYVDERNRERLSAMKAAYIADKTGTCEFCGVTFHRVHRDRRFCSNSCSAKHWRRNRTAAT